MRRVTPWGNHRTLPPEVDDLIYRGSRAQQARHYLVKLAYVGKGILEMLLSEGGRRVR